MVARAATLLPKAAAPLLSPAEAIAPPLSLAFGCSSSASFAAISSAVPIPTPPSVPATGLAAAEGGAESGMATAIPLPPPPVPL
ncbi:MAG: hypothetical protein ACD_20C00320G0001 [uncultured bacterium]|nr:MAG: hypothetical protein ACD_20C00320G0001 [uncultured bacterium]